MSKGLSFKELKKAIDAGENSLVSLEEKDDNSNKRKYKRVFRALENGYKVLNSSVKTQTDIDKAAEKIWKALEDDDSLIIIWIFLFGFLLSAALVFTAYHTYSFIDSNWDKQHHHHRPPKPDIDEDLSKLVTVNYKETNIVNLVNLMTVSDAKGLNNSAQEFQIYNDGSKLKAVNYKVNYSVNIVELNKSFDDIIDKKYLKYRLIYTDNKGNEVLEPIRTFADLKQNPDGSYQMFKGVQDKNGINKFKVIIWLSANANNDQQNRSYTFAFKVNAAISND